MRQQRILTNLSLIFDYNFRPAPDHTGAGPGEVERFSARIGAQAQREQIGKPEGSLDMHPIIGLKPRRLRRSRR